MCKHCNHQQSRMFTEMFFEAARIVSGDTYRYVHHHDGRGFDYSRSYEGRAWFKREYDKHRLHDAVQDAIERYRPDNWHQLLLEWPHKAVTDPNKVAYTENERKGEADRQTLTTPGKYLRRHFSSMPDHELRDIVARFTYAGGIEIVSDMANMIEAVVNGPSSCMSRDFNIRCNDGEFRHPYEVYDPALGWSMAVRVQDGKILGRCLVFDGDIDGEHYKGFVRSYKRHPDERQHSGVDEAIEAYLKNLGYTKWGGWPEEARLLHYQVNGGFLAPYIDGDTRHVEIYNEDYLVIDSGGDYCCDNTCGTASGAICECEDCGESIYDEDDVSYVGRGEDTRVCNDCIDHYTYVYGRRGNQYYIHDDYVVHVGDESYDEDYLSDNDIVELHDGGYAHMNDAVLVGDDWYDCDDDDICYAADTEQYELRSDCWQCYASDAWYTNETAYVEVDGETYHPDNAPEVETDNETE